jgi:5-aminolevulinate synthase
VIVEDHYLFVLPLKYPTVPRGTERLRLTPGPFHSDEMVDRLVTALRRVMDQVADEGSSARIAE